MVSIDGMESDYDSSSDEEMLESNGVSLRAAIQLDDVGYFKQHFNIRKTDNEFKTLIVELGGNIYRHFSSYLRCHRSLLLYMIQTDHADAMSKLFRYGNVYSDIPIDLKIKIVLKNGLIYRNLLRRTLYMDSEFISHLVRHDRGDCFTIMNVRFLDLEPRLQMTVRIHRDTKVFDHYVFTRELTRDGVVNMKPKVSGITIKF